MSDETTGKDGNRQAVGLSDCFALLVGDLKPMTEAPRDGTEILAYSKDGKNLHPVMWKDWPWMKHNVPCWGNRWNLDYRQCDGDFVGWVHYPALAH